MDKLRRNPSRHINYFYRVGKNMEIEFMEALSVLDMIRGLGISEQPKNVVLAISNGCLTTN